MYDKDHPIVFKTRCHLCIHKFSGIPGCAAYPSGIPHALAIGDVLHEEPYPGDQGIRFEPNPKYVKAKESE
jgi:hypothetical protein